VQAPALVTVRRGAALQGDQVGFALTVEKAGLAGLLLFAAQTGLQPALGEPLADTSNGDE